MFSQLTQLEQTNRRNTFLPSKFGVDLNELDNIFSIAKACDLDIIGVCFHVGSNCMNVDSYCSAIRDAKEAFNIGEKYGFHFTMLDIGGGFPGNDENLKFEDIAKSIKESLEEYFYSSPEYKDLEVIAEPGRYFVCTSHTIVLNIIGKKEYSVNGEKSFKYYLNDGVYGSFNCIHFDHAKPEICPYNERDGVLYKSVIFGPTCDSMDTISTDCMLPDLAIGEWVYAENFGSYSVSAASSFNGFKAARCYYCITKQ